MWTRHTTVQLIKAVAACRSQQRELAEISSEKRYRAFDYARSCPCGLPGGYGAVWAESCQRQSGTMKSARGLELDDVACHLEEMRKRTSQGAHPEDAAHMGPMPRCKEQRRAAASQPPTREPTQVAPTQPPAGLPPLHWRWAWRSSVRESPGGSSVSGAGKPPRKVRRSTKGIHLCRPHRAVTFEALT